MMGEQEDDGDGDEQVRREDRRKRESKRMMGMRMRCSRARDDMHILLNLLVSYESNPSTPTCTHTHAYDYLQTNIYI